MFASSAGSASVPGSTGFDPPPVGVDSNVEGATDTSGGAVVDDGDTDVPGSTVVVDVAGASVVVVDVVDEVIEGGEMGVDVVEVVDVDVDVEVDVEVVEVDVEVVDEDDGGGSSGTQLPSMTSLGQFWPGKSPNGGITSSACCRWPETALSDTSM